MYSSRKIIMKYLICLEGELAEQTINTWLIQPFWGLNSTLEMHTKSTIEWTSASICKNYVTFVTHISTISMKSFFKSSDVHPLNIYYHQLWKVELTQFTFISKKIDQKWKRSDMQPFSSWCHKHFRNSWI